MSEKTPMPDVFSTAVASYPHFILPGEVLSIVVDQPKPFSIDAIFAVLSVRSVPLP